MEESCSDKIYIPAIHSSVQEEVKLLHPHEIFSNLELPDQSTLVSYKTLQSVISACARE